MAGEKVEQVVVSKEDKPADGFFICGFCHCRTNARLRACCEPGNLMDGGTLDEAALERWMSDALYWSQSTQSQMQASRVVVLIAMLRKLREAAEATKPDSVSYEVDYIDQVNEGRVVWAQYEPWIETEEFANETAREVSLQLREYKTTRVMRVTRVELSTFREGKVDV